MQFQKIYLLIPRPLNFADASIFLAKNQHFFSKNSGITQINSIRAVLDNFLVLFSGFINENGSFIDHAFGSWLQDGCKLAINRKKTIKQ